MFVNKPPMGWNSWNTFAHEINDELIRSIADKMVEDGYLDAGYEYLVIDDCWSEQGACRLRPFKGPEIRHLFLLRQLHLRRVSGLV